MSKRRRKPDAYDDLITTNESTNESTEEMPTVVEANAVLTAAPHR